MTIDFYYTLYSVPCRSVILLAKTLGIELNLKRINTRNNEHRTPEYLNMNPQHCIPTLVDDGFVIWESRAILAYLVNKYAKDDSLHPKDPKKHATVDQRLYFDLATLYPPLLNLMFVLRSGNAPSAELVKKIEDAFEFLDRFLEGQDWVAGRNITIADYSIVVTVSMTEVFDYDIGKHKNVTKWFTRAKKTIPGYHEIQDAGNAEFKKTLPPR